VVVSEFIVDQLMDDGVLLVRDSLSFVGVRPTEMFRVGRFVFAREVQYVLHQVHLQPFQIVLHLDFVQEGGLELGLSTYYNSFTKLREVETHDRLESGTSIIPLMGPHEYVSSVPFIRLVLRLVSC
jgi:hypothetical protein